MASTFADILLYSEVCPTSSYCLTCWPSFLSRLFYVSLQAQGLCQFASFPDKWHQHPQFILGITLFLLGFAINLYSDAKLRHLRSLSVNRRQIPTGALFEYVSSPHYFGEIVEWTGFCVASNFSLATVAFAVYTAANLIPRGVAHHKWYHENFPNVYPANRRAVIPFLL